LNGKACPYYDFNPIIRGMRDLLPLSDPTIGFKKHFNFDSWVKSIQNCIEGPSDSKVPPLRLFNHEKDSFELGYYQDEENEEFYIESEEEEEENKLYFKIK